MTFLAAAAIGGRVRRRWWQFDHPALAVAVDASLGLLVISYALFVMAMCGLATRAGTVVLLLFLIAVVAVSALRGDRFSADLTQLVQRARRALLDGSAAKFALVGAALQSVLVVLVATLPPTAIDELIYHLEIPRQILAAGHLPFMPDNIFVHFPLGTDMLFAFGLGVGGEVAARLFHALFGVLTGLAIFGFVREWVPRRLALLAAGLFLTIPSVVVLSSWAYVDLAFTCYATVALMVTWTSVHAARAGDESGALRWTALAGLLAGAAWTTKYTGLQLVLLLALVSLIERLRAGRASSGTHDPAGSPRSEKSGKSDTSAGDSQPIPWGAFVVPVLGALVVAPYLVRNWWITGWPLYPFAAGPFGSELAAGLNWDADRASLLMVWLQQYGALADRTFLDRALAALQVFVTARFDDLTAFDGVIGPVFLLSPLALIRRDRPAVVGWLSGFAITFLFYWAITTTQVRFLLPALPAAAVLLAIAAAVPKTGRWLVPLLLLAVVVNVGVAARHVLSADPVAYWAGEESREQYLTRRVAGYPLYAEANRVLRVGERVYLVNMRNFGYLFEAPSLADNSALEDDERAGVPRNWSADYVFQQYSLGNALERASTPLDVERFFRERGATHLMIDEALTFGVGGGGLPPRERGLVVGYLQTRGTLLLRNPQMPSQSLWRLN